MAAARPTWQGYIRFSLVSIPAKGYTATASGGAGGDVHLHQLHKGCGARIKYTKSCPIHGELKADEIESGYEFAKDQYVTVDSDTLGKLRKGGDKTIGIESFIPRNCIAPRFYSGRTMYLLPDGPIGGKPYAMLHALLTEQKRFAFCTATMNGREQLMLMRPVDQLLGLEFLKFASEVKPPSDLIPELPHPTIAKKELDLARTLFEQLTDDSFQLKSWTNHYAADLRKLIDAKVAGQEVVTPPEEEQPQVTDLMQALRKSLDQAKARSGGEAASEATKASPRPSRIKKPSTAAKRTAARATQRPRRRA